MNLRTISYRILLEWQEKKKFIDHIFADMIYEKPYLTSEKAYLQFMVYGVLRRHFSCEFVLDKVSNGRWRKMKKSCQVLIKLACFELLYSRQKPHAIIYEFVEIAKQERFYFESKIINALLRSIQREKDSLIEVIASHPDIQIRFNIPNELDSYLNHFYSRDQLNTWYESLLNMPKYFWLRNEDSGNFIKIEELSDYLPAINAGKFSVQDISAGDVVDYYGNLAGKKVLDYCSAPGGKTLMLANRFKSKIDLTSTDISSERLKLVSQNLKRLNIDTVKVLTKSDLLLQAEVFDVILLDIPCSGLGTVSKHPDMLHYFTFDKLKEIEEVQKVILEEIQPLLKPQAEVFISTCSILPSENELLVNYFLETYPNFARKNADLIRLPFQGDRDGSYCASLIRKD